MPEPAHYDAFISYASVDRRRARRIQRFIESWVDRHTGRRLKAFLDETDIRGGSLSAELRRAAHGARTLIVCYSPATAESRWVDEEVRLFSERAEPDRIAIAIVAGNTPPQAAGRELVSGAELRVHDLRRGRWLGLIGLGVKLELLRLLAFVADVDLRTLRNWHVRRTALRVAWFIVFALLPVGALLSVPLEDWEQLDLTIGRERIYAISAEADGERLLVASRFRGAGPQGFRDYIQVADGVFTQDPKIGFNEIALSRRLLPLALMPHRQRTRIPTIDLGAHTDRTAAGPPFVGEIAEDRFIIVVPLAPTQDELDEATDQSHDFGTPIPTVKGSVIATIEGRQRVAAEVPDFSPVWESREGSAGPTSPSRGLAVAWSPEGDLWLGMTGRDAREAGGLWLRRAGQSNWERMRGFASVQSIELDILDGRTRAVRVAEKHVELWSGIRLVPRPTRAVMRAVGDTEWRPASAPPFGTRSEVEWIGHFKGSRMARVDEHLYRQGSLPLWRFLLKR